MAAALYSCMSNAVSKDAGLYVARPAISPGTKPMGDVFVYACVLCVVV